MISHHVRVLAVGALQFLVCAYVRDEQSEFLEMHCNLFLEQGNGDMPIVLATKRSASVSPATPILLCVGEEVV
jgi:hypothetical protein